MPSSPTMHIHQHPSLTTQDQIQPFPRSKPVKDQITYSIPSSIWRQDQVSHSPAPTASQPNSHNEPQRSDSFYWQSPRSSVHSAKDEDEDVDAVTIASKEMKLQQPAAESNNKRNDSGTTATSSLLSHSTLGPYGASALGFGGPSDWEHFGDYEAEEIDDTELYTRSKASVQPVTNPESTELPNSSLSDTDSLTTRQLTSAQSHSSLPGSAQRLKARTLGMSQVAKSIEASPEPGQAANIVGQGQDLGAALDSNPNTAEHEVLLSEAKVSSPSSDVLEDDAFATNLNETIQAWSKASSTDEEMNSTNSPKSENERLKDHSHEQKPLTDTLGLDTAVHVASTDIVSDSEGPLNPPETRDDGLDPKQNAATANAMGDLPQQAPLPPDAIGPSVIVAEEKPISNGSNSIIQDEADKSKELPHVQPTLVANPGPSAKAKETNDPYAGLDAWGKASLNRYIAMLREESEAQTDRDKLNIFTVFTSRETRLRAVLYGAENEPPTDPSTSARTTSVKRATTTVLKRASKALPALPGEDNPAAPPQLEGQARKSSVKLSTVTSLGTPKPKPISLPSLDTAKTSSSEDLDSVQESPVEIRFSPGGRPIVPRAANVDRVSYTSEPETLTVANGDRNSDMKKPSEPSPSSATKQLQEGQPAADDSSVYKPFKYNEGRSEAYDYAANRQSKRQSQFRPYAAKTMDSDEYRDMFLADRPVVGSATGVSLADKVTQAGNKSDEEAIPDLRRFVRADFDPLLSVLPESGEIRTDPTQLSELTQVATAVPDDFGFIHQSVVAWDAKSRRQRETNERERHARQIESEQKIDALFDDHEIGYGDISELESGFKRSEAARKADEDRLEYKTFVAEVFNVVWARLHYEIDQLNPRYEEYTKILNDSTAGKDMFNPAGDRIALAPTMDALLTLHQKLEIRHQKAFEAVLERDRRLKKTELSPWYSLGNVAKVKQLEKQFEDAEKKAIVEYCRQRDIRANNLMDVLDQNTLRGVGANQDYMEMVMKAVRRIASGRAFASQPGGGEPGVGLDEVTKAKSVTKALATSSEQIVQTFHVADMLLNAADYELSVAKAKFSKADAITFQTLREERAKEDQKLIRDLEHRLALIREDSRRTHDEIVKLLLFLGVHNGHAESPSQALDDIGHEERLQRALEEAKKRNAVKVSGIATVL